MKGDINIYLWLVVSVLVTALVIVIFLYGIGAFNRPTVPIID